MAAIPFVTESRPAPGFPIPVAEGVSRILAPNRGVLTHHGTNSYVVATPDGPVVIDPGPEDREHVEALLTATGGKVAAILITHGHGDHVAAAAALKAATGAPIHASPASIAEDLAVDVPLVHGSQVHGLRPLHTPGHSPDHFSFAMGNEVVFTGDHVMTWSTTAVSPPRGSMIDYRRSLSLLLEESDWKLLLPGHGAPSREPAALMSALMAHRLERERQVLAWVKAGAGTPPAIADRIYAGLAPERRGPAERTVLAYLLSLAAAGLVAHDGDTWRSSSGT
ncbi:MBL fold metallo-hydrolase [Pseudomonas sp. R2.Fl]|nr:MBL fold metallo-hydrolase [Pseudomonas sp. R2.Fl]